MKGLILKQTLLVIFVSFISGCSNQYIAKQQSQAALQDIPVNWQEGAVNLDNQQPFLELDLLFKQPQLRALIQEATANNPDIQELALKMKASNSMMIAIGAKQYPTLDLDIKKSRSKQEGDVTSSYQYGLNVAWEIDIWGKLADHNSAALADYNVTKWEYQAITRNIAVRVVRLWIEGWALNQSQLNAQNHLSKLLKIETVILENYRNGITQLEDLSSTRQQQENTYADMITTNEKINKNYREMSLLLGRLPDKSVLFDNNELPHIVSPPLAIPAHALARRPDVQIAFSQLQSLDAQTRASYKALLPSINLSGNISRLRNTGALNDFFSGSTVWSLVGGITQPIFNASNLKAQANASSYNAEAAWWHYRKTILTAVFEVENALALEQSFKVQKQHLYNAQQQSLKVQQIYKDKYLSGSVDVVRLIEAQLKKLEVDARIIQTQAAQMDNRILLALAMGYDIPNTLQHKEISPNG